MACSMLTALPQSGSWWETIVPGLTRKQWLDNFRMSKESMPILVRQLRHDVERRDTLMRRAIDVERRIACVIWVLAAQCGYCTAGHLFGVSDSSISNIMRDVCFAIAMILLTAPPDGIFLGHTH